VQLAPLQGPEGLYNVSVMPRFLLDSGKVGWRGAYFTAIDGASDGIVDHAHERYCIQRGLHVEARRTLGRDSWQDVPIGFEIWQAGQEQRFCWRRGGRSQFLFFSPMLVEDVLDGASLRHALPQDGQSLRSKDLELIFDAIESDLAQGSPAGSLVGDALITALIARLAGWRDTDALSNAARDRAIEYIHARFTQTLTLAEIATAAGVGVRQLCRSFKRATGLSPHQYLLKQRVEHAKRLIEQGLAISDVAIQCGFSDQSQLTRVFTRHEGTTPGRYRAQMRA
jgi:AraC-like DNA-binding protein